jgi:hypothetical protein
MAILWLASPQCRPAISVGGKRPRSRSLIFAALLFLPTLSIEPKADQLQNSPADAEHENHAHFDEAEPRGIHDAPKPLRAA